jgi:hypothetical protein
MMMPIIYLLIIRYEIVTFVCDTENDEFWNFRRLLLPTLIVYFIDINGVTLFRGFLEAVKRDN